jgi:hypothetical protein
MLLYCSQTMLKRWISRNLIWLLIFVHMSYQKQHFPALIFIPLLATGWKVRGLNPSGGEIFRTCPDRPWCPPSLLYNGYRVFPGGKEQPGRDADPSPFLVPWSRKGRAIPLLPQQPCCFTFMCQLSSNSGSLNHLEPKGPVQVCIGTTVT